MSERDILLDKLAYFRREHAISSNAAQKFELQHQIREIEKRVEELSKEGNTQNSFSLPSLEKFKNELRKDIEESEITSYFEKIEECNYKYDKSQFSRLKKEFIHGKTDFDFTERLRLFINTFKEKEA
jgi:TolA-binding protein